MILPLSLIKVFVPTAVAFFIGVLVTPLFTHFFYKYKLWKRRPRKADELPETEEISAHFKRIHNTEAELKTPRPGGLIIWVSVALAVLVIFIVSKIFPTAVTEKLDFLSRGQTLLPFFALIAGSLIGLADDLMAVFVRRGVFVNGFPRRMMIGIVTAIGLIAGWWFFAKLGVTAIAVPFNGFLELGWLIVPLFAFVVLATFSGSVIDGVDGMSGGVLAITFAAYAFLAYFQNLMDIAALCGAISGAILAFLWFNIPPARFYMGETGMLGLTVTLAIIAFLTDSVLLLPIIALPLTVTALSSAIQIVGKKLFGPRGKVFKVAPLHHHFEAIGWSREKIVMRYWVISVVFAVIGILIALISN